MKLFQNSQNYEMERNGKSYDNKNSIYKDKTNNNNNNFHITQSFLDNKLDIINKRKKTIPNIKKANYIKIINNNIINNDINLLVKTNNLTDTNQNNRYSISNDKSINIKENINGQPFQTFKRILKYRPIFKKAEVVGGDRSLVMKKKNHLSDLIKKNKNHIILNKLKYNIENILNQKPEKYRTLSEKNYYKLISHKYMKNNLSEINKTKILTTTSSERNNENIFGNDNLNNKKKIIQNFSNYELKKPIGNLIINKLKNISINNNLYSNIHTNYSESNDILNNNYNNINKYQIKKINLNPMALNNKKIKLIYNIKNNMIKTEKLEKHNFNNQNRTKINTKNIENYSTNNLFSNNNNYFYINTDITENGPFNNRNYFNLKSNTSRVF